jgi:hypothetical protein
MSREALLDILRGVMLKSADLNPDVVLQPHQERIREKLKQDIPGLLAYHGLGSGKTLASMAAGEATPGPKEVIVPAALRENYMAQLRRFVTDPKQYHIRSYDLATATQGQPRAGLTIFDEAQRMGRPESQMSKLPGLVHGKKLLLSGTPIRNEPSELVPILQAISSDRDIPQTSKEFDKRFIDRQTVTPGFLGRLFGRKEEVVENIKNRAKLKALLAGRVDYHPTTGAFPGVSEENIDVDMSPPQTEMYNGLLNSQPILAHKIRRNLPPSKQESQQLNAFMAGVRQISNNPRSYDTRLQELPGDDVDHSPKMKRMIDEVTKRAQDPDFRGLIYSNYLESGIIPLSRRLSALGISNAVFTGDIGDLERRRIVEGYNKGKIKTLLISGAGAEGLDLRGTQLVQIMEPHWNNPRLDQVIGRAVRYGSHSHLPKEKQKVMVQRFFSRPQPGLLQRLGIMSQDTGIDHYLHELSTRKQRLAEQVLSVLREVGSETVNS